MTDDQCNRIMVNIQIAAEELAKLIIIQTLPDGNDELEHGIFKMWKDNYYATIVGSGEGE